MSSYEIVTSWDGFKWGIRHGKRYEHDRAVLSKGELSCLKALTLVASKDKVFVDVGAHVGYYCVRMAKLYKHVYAFEPNPENRENLEFNVKLNDLNNVTIFPYALGDKNEVRRFYLRSAGSTFIPVNDAYEVINVEVKRMDDLIDVADVVKIDVEGWEYNVLIGMQRIIDTCKPFLLIEHHDARGYPVKTYSIIRNWLMSKGYYCLYVTTFHRFYFHKDVDISLIKPLIVNHWINHCILNLRYGKNWYDGLPYT